MTQTPGDGAPAPKPAPKPAEPAKEVIKEAPKELPIGPMGQFLKDLGIKSTRAADSVGSFGPVETLEVAADDLEQTMRRLRTSPETGMGLLLMVSGVETPEAFDSVYHLWSYTDPQKELVVKVRLPKADVPEGRLPHIPSITPFWPAANWHEREEYDLMGIKFHGHPYLRRLMNPWDWEGHPLRKDYKQPIDALNDKNPHSMR